MMRRNPYGPPPWWKLIWFNATVYIIFTILGVALIWATWVIVTALLESAKGSVT